MEKTDSECATAMDLSFLRLAENIIFPNALTNVREIHLCHTYLCPSKLDCILLQLNQTSLQTLHIGSNPALCDLPPRLSLFSYLSTLGMGACQIEILPEWICSLPRLEELHARDNCISRLPNDMWVGCALKTLFPREPFAPSLRSTRRRWCISFRRGPLSTIRFRVVAHPQALTRLRHMDLRGNRLAALPPGPAPPAGESAGAGDQEDGCGLPPSVEVGTRCGRAARA